MNTSSAFMLATAEGRYFFNPSEIVRLEASSNYTRIYFTNNKKMVSAKVLKEFVSALEPFGFVRTHRTHLINRQHILCITPEGAIIMKDASVAAISRRMKGSVMKVLKNAA
ncbi:MAG TPA: LytTR family DNA-binding domain-containing protein [Chitinophagaceae bacterium]|nr:LytTR family DNA-binding domain-containing protein [Chitinophagaceae bacterium]